MSGVTVPLGFPYPTGGDPLAGVDDAIKALAEAVDDKIAADAAGAAWANAGLASGWAAGANGAVYKLRDGVVTLSVHVIKASWTVGDTVFTLPAGFRPSRTLVWTGHPTHFGTILSTGVVTIQTVPGTSGGAYFCVAFPLGA